MDLKPVRTTRGRHRAALLVVALGTCSGCATALNQYGYWHGGEQSDWSPLRDVWWVYGGAATDLLNIRRAEASTPGTLSFIDLPLSTAADTILLPMTIVQQVVGRSGAQDEDADSYRRRFATTVHREPEIRRDIPLEGVRGWRPFQVSFWNAESWHVFDRSYDVRGGRLNLLGGTVRSVTGVDLGVLGFTEYSLTGLQANAVGSFVEGRSTGLQLGVLGSRALEVRGVQVGGYVNAANEVYGAQIGGLHCGGAPRPPKVTGVQISLFNDAMNLTGIQIGLINIHRKGWLPVCPLINIGFGGSEEDS